MAEMEQSMRIIDRPWKAAQGPGECGRSALHLAAQAGGLTTTEGMINHFMCWVYDDVHPAAKGEAYGYAEGGQWRWFLCGSGRRAQQTVKCRVRPPCFADRGRSGHKFGRHMGGGPLSPFTVPVKNDRRGDDR